jgi:hypothetical protein
MKTRQYDDMNHYMKNNGVERKWRCHEGDARESHRKTREK